MNDFSFMPIDTINNNWKILLKVRNRMDLLTSYSFAWWHEHKLALLIICFVTGVQVLCIWFILVFINTNQLEQSPAKNTNKTATFI